MLKNVRNSLFIAFVISVFVYAAFFIYSDYKILKNLLTNYPLENLTFSLLLIVASLFVKFYRWQLYIEVIKINISIKHSLLYFFSGLIMGITPGKVGELFKSFLIRKNYGIPLSVTSPVIFAERIIEFGALIIILALGTLNFDNRLQLIFVPLLAVLVLVILFANETINSIFIEKFSKTSIFKNRINDVSKFNDSIKVLFKRTIFLKSLALSIAAWILECIAFYMVVVHFNPDISLLWSSFTYCFSLIVGAVSFLPGGIGAAEGTLSYLMVIKDFSESSAIASTLIIRIITLWFSVVLGFLSYFLYIITNEKGKKIVK